VYRQAGIVLPRNAREQILTGEEVPYDFARMRPGDLLFYGTPASPGRRMVVSHVAMYFGDRKIIHSSQLVRINSLIPGEKDYYGRNILHVRRILGHLDEGELPAVYTKDSPAYFK
jgi:cell wall-associated NlpC family hydrolase